MATHNLARRKLMPDFGNFTEGDFKVTLRPFGKRNWIWGLRWLLWRWPYISGCRPRIVVKVENQKEPQWTTFSFQGQLLSDGGLQNLNFEGVMGKGTTIHLPWLTGTGAFNLTGHLRVSDGTITNEIMNGTILGFDLKSSDTAFMWGTAIIGSLLISIIAAAITTFGGYWLNRETSPTEVIIVEPTPALQLGTDNNEP